MATSSNALTPRALFYMALLAVQFAVQPILTKKYLPKDADLKNVVIATEILKIFLGSTMLSIGSARGQAGEGGWSKALKGWSIKSWITVAGVPAVLYSMQNLCALTAYRNLDSVTFNVLNQTKTLSAALFCFVIMGRRQSKIQVAALILLVLAALIIEGTISVESLLGATGGATPKEESVIEVTHFTLGVLPCLAASLISGLAGALSQLNLQKGGGRNSYFFSMELAVFSIMTLGASKFVAGREDSSEGRLVGMPESEWSMLIPVALQASGGLIVGLVTKYAGPVRKGFSLLVGIVLTGIMQSVATGEAVSSEQLYGTVLVIIATFLHLTNPYMQQQPISNKKKQ